MDIWIWKGKWKGKWKGNGNRNGKEMEIEMERKMEINKKSCLPGIGFEPMTSGL